MKTYIYTYILDIILYAINISYGLDTSHVCVSFCLAQLSVAVCIGFLTAWSPYAIVSMWAAFGDPENVPPMAFALAAMFAKSSTLYNPIVYLVFKPNFRKSLCGDVALFRGMLCACLCQPDPVQKKGGNCSEHLQHEAERRNSTRPSNGTPDNHSSCRHCPDGGSGEHRPDYTPQKTARLLTGWVHSEVAVSQLSNEVQSDFL